MSEELALHDRGGKCSGRFGPVLVDCGWLWGFELNFFQRCRCGATLNTTAWQLTLVASHKAHTIMIMVRSMQVYSKLSMSSFPMPANPIRPTHDFANDLVQ